MLDWYEPTQRDWTEDFPHENGNYNCKCLMCGEMFIGHKRRFTCRVCAEPEGDPEGDNV